MQRLSNTVAVVTGASRGAGRGIAHVLGQEGAIVYVTGHSVRGNSTRPELLHTTIENTAEMVTAAGGLGIPVQVDHTVDTEVAALFNRVRQEQGRLDLLVNNAWGGYHDSATNSAFDAVFWEQPLDRFDRMFTAGVRSHLSASWFAVPLMLSRRRGLIVNTTLDVAADHYDQALFYLAAKHTVNYLTFGMAHDLHQRSRYDITVVALAPGWMRTEAVMSNTFPHTLPATASMLKQTESVEYVGRAIVALATDPHVITKSGQTLRVRDLAREYGFTDVDCRQPT